MKFSVGFGRSRNRNKVGKTLITFCHNKPKKIRISAEFCRLRFVVGICS